LLLGLVRLHGELAWLGITLQHPPIGLVARPAASQAATGARADLAQAQAARAMQALGLPPAELEIEYAIPRHLGLASDPMMSLAAARALAALAHDPRAEDALALAKALGLAPHDTLAVHGFDHGGVLLVAAESAQPLKRFELAHGDDDHSWAWVLHWPFPAEGTPPTYEGDRLDHLLAAGPHLSNETGRLVEEDLWPALEGDDMAAFGQALMGVQRLNRAALAAAGTPPASAPSTEGVLKVLADSGCLAWGESAAGLAPFGLIRGGPASLAVRRQLVAHVGYEGGSVTAAICDNRGATHREVVV
jgi:predicted sugar kinase